MKHKGEGRINLQKIRIGIIFGGILIADFFLLILDPMDNNKFDDIYFLIGLWLFAIVQILHIIRYNSRPEDYDSPAGPLLKRFWSLIKDLELKRDKPIRK